MSNPAVRFSGLFPHEDGAGIVQFEITSLTGEHVGYFQLLVGPTKFGSTDAMLGVAHRQMSSIAKVWSDQLLDQAVGFEQRQAS